MLGNCQIINLCDEQHARDITRKHDITLNTDVLQLIG